MTQLDIFGPSGKKVSDVLRKLVDSTLRPTQLADRISEASGTEYLPILDMHQSWKDGLELNLDVKDKVPMSLY